MAVAKFIATLALVVMLDSVACAQPLTDESEMLKRLTSEGLNIPEEICKMTVSLPVQGGGKPIEFTFCQYAHRAAATAIKRGLSRPLPMARIKPPGQLVEMVGIPLRANGTGEIGGFFFKNRGGVLVLGGVYRFVQSIDGNRIVGGQFAPINGPVEEILMTPMILATMSDPN